MANTKYSKHLIEAPIGPAKYGPPVQTLHFSAGEHGVDKVRGKQYITIKHRS